MLDFNLCQLQQRVPGIQGVTPGIVDQSWHKQNFQNDYNSNTEYKTHYTSTHTSKKVYPAWHKKKEKEINYLLCAQHRLSQSAQEKYNTECNNGTK